MKVFLRMICFILFSSCSCDFFPRTFIIKGNANNGRNPQFFTALETRFLDIALINEEVIGCINKEAMDTVTKAAIVPINSPFCFFSFHVLVAPSVNSPEFYSDSTILIISSLSSFEINKVNYFPVLTVRFRFAFLSNLCITFELHLKLYCLLIQPNYL